MWPTSMPALSSDLREAGKRGRSSTRVRRPYLPLSTSVKKRFISQATLWHMLDHPLLSREAEAGLSKRIKAGDETARHELVRHNLRLAWAFATRGEVGGGARTEDLFGEAVVALYRAAKRFDAALGTFAQFCEFHLREAWRKHARFEGYSPSGSRALRAQAEQLRRLLAATAERLSFAWTLEVVRGEVPRSVLAWAGASDLLVLGRSEYAWPGANRRIDPAQRFPALAARPVAAVFDGSATALRALSIASTLAEVTGSELVILIAAAGAEAFKDLRQRAMHHLAGRASASYLCLSGSEPGIVIRTARSRNLGVLLWPGCIEDLTPAQLSELPCPVVVFN